MAKTLLGKLGPAAVGRLKLPRLPADVMEGYRALADLTGTVSDALDECAHRRGGARLGAQADRAAGAPGRPGADGAQPAAQGQGVEARRSRGAQDHSRGIGYPVWSSSVSPISGKRRIETVAVNKTVKIAGIRVNPGDLVIADEVGVCFVPFRRAAEVLEVAQRLAKREKGRLAKLATGVPLSLWLAS